MTVLLYMPSVEGNYIRSFDAVVETAKHDYLTLDRTAFYPEGGGQPSDTGTLSWADGSAKIVKIEKKGIIKHSVAPAQPGNTLKLPEVGTAVHGEIDWPLRYSHMRMHTAQHLLSGIVFELYHAQTVGNQIHATHSRVDFQPAAFSNDDIARIEGRCNAIITSAVKVRIFEEPLEHYQARPEAARINLTLLPKAVQTLRIVEIPGVDAVPCAGTHIACVSELQRVKILKRESKGAQIQRIEYTLEPLPGS